MKKRVAVLGSTGSIGRQTLEVIGDNPDLFELTAITAYKNEHLLQAQKVAFGVKHAYLSENNTDILVSALESGVDIAVIATAGIGSLNAVLKAIEGGVTVALANKEVLVAGGELINDMLANTASKIIPVDSEHSAVFQCLERVGTKAEKIILTASGGPFYGYTPQMLKDITPEKALRHPKWKMGQKITIDSATMMNKGLEIIEAFYLFGIDNIQVVVHPECIVHSMIETADGAVFAQLACPDMRLPIQYALTYPERRSSKVPTLDLVKEKSLTFLPLKQDIFPATEIALEALRSGGYAPTVLLAADDCAVKAFIEGRMGFTAIIDTVKEIMSTVPFEGKVEPNGIRLKYSQAYTAAEAYIKKRYI